MKKILNKKNNISASLYKFKRIGGERNRHGTRICCKILCSICKKIDYVSVHVYREVVLCRKCAQERLFLFEQSIEIPKKQKNIKCTRCGVTCILFNEVKDPSKWLCLDCFRGFDVWSGSILNVNKNRKSIVEIRQSGNLIRRKKNN